MDARSRFAPRPLTRVLRSVSLAAVLVCAWSMCSACARLSSQQWPGFRGPLHTGVMEGYRTPERWDVDANVNVVWKTPIPGHGHSSPIVWGDRIFLTTAIGSRVDMSTWREFSQKLTPSTDQAPQVWKVLCLDRRTGRLLWERTADAGVPKDRLHPLNSFATPTPATDGRFVVVFFGSQGLFCYTMDGTLVWRRDLGVLRFNFFVDRAYEWGPASSPVIFKDLVIVQCDADRQPFLAAYALATGEEVWRVRRQDFSSWSTPTIAKQPGGATLITVAPNWARGYDPSTGRERWRLYWGADVTMTSSIGWKRMLFLLHGKVPTSLLHAVRADARGDLTLDGGRDTNDSILWTHHRLGPITGMPIVYRDQLYVLNDIGVLRAFDATSGRLLYQQRLAGWFVASTVAADGKLYFTNIEGDVHVVAAGPQFRLLGTSALGALCQATPAISHGTLYVRTIDALLAIRES